MDTSCTEYKSLTLLQIAFNIFSLLFVRLYLKAIVLSERAFNRFIYSCFCNELNCFEIDNWINSNHAVLADIRSKDSLPSSDNVGNMITEGLASNQCIRHNDHMLTGHMIGCIIKIIYRKCALDYIHCTFRTGDYMLATTENSIVLIKKCNIVGKKLKATF